MPSDKPTEVEAEHLSPYTARVKWIGIDKLDWQAASINYIVVYKLQNGANSKEEKVVVVPPSTVVLGSNELEVELSGLTVNSTYSVWVLATNVVGDGERSEEATFTTNSCKCFLAPNDLQ